MCKQCQTKPVYEFTNQRKLCGRCFVNYFQKKVLYTIRKFGMIRNGDAVGYFSSNHFRRVVLEDVLEMFAERANVELVKNGKKGKLAISSTLDSESEGIIQSLINGKEKDLEKFKPVSGKIIKPLYLFSDEEVLLYAKLRVLCFDSCHYAKLRKLKFRKIEKPKDKISEFLDGLEKKHPEVKRAIVNGYLGLYG